MELNAERKMLAAAVVVVVALLGTTVYFYRQYSSIRQNPQKFVQQSVDKIVEEVAQYMRLPDGETPTIATVVDVEKLKAQPFFTNATNGDRVLIYTNARKAILYNPTTHKIIEVAPITLGENQGAPATNNTAPAATSSTNP